MYLMLVKNGQHQLRVTGLLREKPEEIGQGICYKNVLTLEWKPAIELRWNVVMSVYLQGMRICGYQQTYRD